jgi:hypothetical protein
MRRALLWGLWTWTFLALGLFLVRFIGALHG